MLFAAKQGLNNARAVILVGTDCPFIDKHYLLSACKALDNNDVVIGPAEDGGYVLLGMKMLYPSLFQNMEWGNDTVFETTVNVLQKNALLYKILPTLNDIDRPGDIRLLQSIPAFHSFF